MYDYLNYVQMYSYLNGKKYSKEYPVQPEPLRTAEHIVISDGITYIGRNAFGSQGVGRTVTVEIGKAVKIIGEEAFYKCNITEIVIPDSVTEIGERAFQYSDIEKLTLGLSLKTIGNEAFSVNNLKSIIIPDSVISIGDYAFYGNDLLEYIELGKSVKTVGEKAFLLSNFYSYNEGADYKPTVRYMIPETVTKIGKYAFGYFDVDGESQSNRWELVVVGKVGSAAYKYCEKYLVEFDDIDGCEKDTHI